MNDKLPRILSEYELDFVEELDLYNKVLDFTTLISLNQGGINTDGRGVRATKIFTRQTVIATSLSRMFPKPKTYTPSNLDFWDVTSQASLARNIIEGYLSLYYFGIENISESEADLRFQILQLHRNIESFNIYYFENKSDHTEFTDVILEQKEIIRNHPYILQLEIQNRKKALQFMEMYKTKFDFEKELIICKDLRKIYRLLSNWVHPVPLSIERIDSLKGTGKANDMDINNCLQCLMLARRFLAASVVGIVDFFPEYLGKKFSKDLDLIRPLQFAGFGE